MLTKYLGLVGTGPSSAQCSSIRSLDRFGSGIGVGWAGLFGASEERARALGAGERIYGDAIGNT
jgi:hypothetical protein